MKEVAIMMSVCFFVALGFLIRTDYFSNNQKELDKLYTSLGVATIRLMDPDARAGVAVANAWALKKKMVQGSFLCSGRSNRKPGWDRFDTLARFADDSFPTLEE